MKKLVTKIVVVLVFAILITLNTYSLANDKILQVTWFGTTTIIISDSETEILFDPFFTRHSFIRVFSRQRLYSDPELVSQWLGMVGKKKIEAIFVSHTHYDHVLDLV